MPSDERVTSALAQFAAPIAAFRGAAATAAERVRGYLAAAGAAGDERATRARAELGAFAAGRIDAGRFAAMVGGGVVIDAMARARLERAEAVLREVASLGDEHFVVEVPAGGDLAAAVTAAWTRLGRAFGAALVADLARGGALDVASHDALLDGMPPATWNRGERRLAPPLVVAVDGADADMGALAGLVDDGTRLVLVIRGACAPALLVRLITPATLVLQTSDAATLARVASADGAGVGALVPAEAARFVHDPARGDAPWQRISIEALPEGPPRKAIGRWSVWQQTQELAQLRALAARPVLAVGGAESAPPGTESPADRLAAWLLQQAKLTELR